MLYMIPTHLQKEWNPIWRNVSKPKGCESTECVSKAYDGPSINVEETADAYLVHAEMPGLEKDEFTVTFMDDHLVIHGEKKEKQESQERNYHWVECAYGSFERTVHFPAPVAAEQVEADYKNGVLSIRLPKTEAAKVKEIPIQFN